MPPFLILHYEAVKVLDESILVLILTYPCNVPLDVFSIEIEFIVPHTFTGVIVIPLSTDDFSPYVP